MTMDLIQLAAARWEFAEDTLDLVAERENKIYSALDAKGRRFALRLHRDGYVTEQEILSELAWADVLSADGVAVPSPLASAEGRLVECIDGRLFSALTWMPGRPMGEGGKPLALRDRQTVFRNIGIALAQLHSTSDGWSPPATFVRRSWDLEGLLGEAPVWGRFWENPFLSDDDLSVITHARAVTRAMLEDIGPSLDYGLIHADALRENILVDGTDVILIDFDDSGYGYRLFEIATTLLRNNDEPDVADLTKALLEGYRTVRPLDTTYLPLFMVLRTFTYLGWIVPRIDEPEGHDRCALFVREAVDFSRRFLEENA
ncbi:MAG: phosphotransferase [Pseudomonadota bacterium]